MSDNLHQRSPVLNAITLLLCDRFELGADESQPQEDQAVYRSRDRRLLVVHCWSKWDRFLHVYYKPEGALVPEAFQLRIGQVGTTNQVSMNYLGPLTQVARNVLRTVCDGCEIVNPKFVP
jgi:hypothetical protein